jgi:hypothetical protein
LKEILKTRRLRVVDEIKSNLTPKIMMMAKSILKKCKVTKQFQIEVNWGKYKFNDEIINRNPLIEICPKQILTKIFKLGCLKLDVRLT